MEISRTEERQPPLAHQGFTYKVANSGNKINSSFQENYVVDVLVRIDKV
jgi:hypothetical protein